MWRYVIWCFLFPVDADKEKKLKQAKKRAEKRRKQKEKNRLREREGKAAGATDSSSSGPATTSSMTMSQSISAMNLDNPEFRRSSVKSITYTLAQLLFSFILTFSFLKRPLLFTYERLIEMSKERIKLELYNSISAGDVEKVQHFMQSRWYTMAL